jgi:hypothetical protein
LLTPDKNYVYDDYDEYDENGKNEEYDVHEEGYFIKHETATLCGTYKQRLHAVKGMA